MRFFVGSVPPRTVLLVIVEHVLILASVWLAMSLQLGSMAAEGLPVGMLWRAAFVAVVLQVCLHYSDLYDLRRLSDRRGVLVSLIQALGAASLVLALVYYWLPEMTLGRGVFVIASVVVIMLVGSWRVVFDWISHRLRPNERLLIVGTGEAAVDLARELGERRQELGAEIVGFVDTDPQRVGASILNSSVVGTVGDIPSIVRAHGVDRVVVSLGDARGKLSMDDLLRMKLNDGVRFDHIASVYEDYTGKIAIENLRPSWLVFSDGFRKSGVLDAAKRGLDLALALTNLLLALPAMGLVALAIRLTSPGPIVYRQQRVGKNGVVFTIYKFRSMGVDAEARTGAIWAVPGDDPRVTPVGRIIRRTRLDELPQLWNVLRGDMSFVGPRPERPEFVADLSAQIPFYGQRHVVRPGLTGWAQVRHEYGASVGDALQKLQYELFYIKHMSLAFDLFIVLETMKTVLVRRGS